MALLGFCQILMDGSPQSSATFGQLLILSVITVLNSYSLAADIPFNHPPAPLTHYNNMAYQSQCWGAWNWGQPQPYHVWQYICLDDHHSTGPRKACMYQTPESNVNLSKRLLIKERHYLSLYKREWIFFPFLHEQQTIFAEKVAFWKDAIYAKVLLEVKLKLKPQIKEGRHFLFEFLQ